jgi:dGTPase
MSLSKRTDIEARERQTLAAYAALASETKGRAYPQAEHPLRTAFQRDRDRVIHSAAFRRMEYKTQVFLPREGDHLRTRLTHTMEVAQIARTLARCLRVNEDLTEAIALAHDLGHTPFGHSGEDALNDLLADRGGFNHNRQSLRVVDLLEQRYAEYPGLNLSYEVREGIAKHETKVTIIHPDFDPKLRPTLEASLVDIADEIAYNGHDVDDGIRAGLISLKEVGDLSICTDDSQEFVSPLRGRRGFDLLSEDQKRHAVVRYLVNLMATDVLNETERQLRKLAIGDLASLRGAPEKVCRYSSALAASVEELKSFLHTKVYRHPILIEMSQRAQEILRTLFARFSQDSSLMPKRFQEMLLTEERDIVIADYIAGMTDRYAQRMRNQKGQSGPV